MDSPESVKSAFIVTSAVFSGVGSEDERTSQTQKTIDSINKSGNYEIFLFDSTGSPDVYGCKVYDISDHENFSVIRKLVDLAPDINVRGFKEGYLKNLSEIQIIMIALDTIDLSRFERVFKVSGRYCLTKSFNGCSHEKITLRRFSPTWSLDVTGISKRTITSLWSFSPEYTEEVKRVLLESFDYILKRPYENGCSDIEHTFTKFFEKDHVKCLPILGVFGRVDNKREVYL